MCLQIISSQVESFLEGSHGDPHPSTGRPPHGYHYGTLLLPTTPPQSPAGCEDSPATPTHDKPVQNHSARPTISENWPFLASRRVFPVNTAPSRENLLTTTPLNTHHRDTTPTGTKPTQQHIGKRLLTQPRHSQHAVQNSPSTPTSSPAGTKLSPQHPAWAQPVKLSRHAKATKLAISREQENLSPFPTRRHRAGEFSPATTPSWCLFQRS